MAGADDRQMVRPDRRMPAPERRQRILQLLDRSGYVTISEIAGALGVSDMTVRRDVDALAKEGKATRAHGGAIGMSAGQAARVDLFEPAVDQRMQRNREAKRAIGRRAAQLLQTGQTIALDIGSTTLCMADAVSDLDVRIFTNSLKIGLFLKDGTPRVYMPGGEMRGNEPSLVGAMARGQLEGFRFDWLFLGASGIAADGLYDYSLDDTEIKRALIERAERTVALVDSSKFDRLSIVKVAELSAVHMLISDRAPEGELADSLHAAGVAVEIVDVNETRNG